MESLDHMEFHLEAFEGPLDLLLHLIAKNKINIYDIPIAEILEQYLSYIDNMKQMDLDVASDFIAMAAQLMLIKSKMLLPRYEDEEEEDPRARLVEMLLEYQRIKEMSGFFSERGEIGRDTFVKPPEPLSPVREYRYQHERADLVRAVKEMFAGSGRKLPPPVDSFVGIVGTENIPVGTKVREILKRFYHEPDVDFMSLILHAKSRSEIVAYFLAVLELSKNRRILIEDAGEGDYTLRLSAQIVPDTELEMEFENG